MFSYIKDLWSSNKKEQEVSPDPQHRPNRQYPATDSKLVDRLQNSMGEKLTKEKIQRKLDMDEESDYELSDPEAAAAKSGRAKRGDNSS